MKLYREVKASERLPYKEEWYFVNVKAPISTPSVHDIWFWKKKDCDYWINTFESWLKPIEITEEEIRKQSEEYEHEQSLGIAEDYANEDFIAGVNWVLSKLKGE